MKMRTLMSMVVAVWLAGVGGVANAVDAGAAPSPGVRIYGGTSSATCAWPVAVLLSVIDNGQAAVCTGTLLAPNIVAYAGHCTAEVKTIYFGENILTPSWGVNKPARTIAMPAGACKVYPGHDPSNGSDFAYCKLPKAVLDVPIVPVLMGCETAALAANKAVTFVGFGLNEAKQVGIKHEVTGKIQSNVSNKIEFGSDGTGVCNGDSGGPTFVQVTSKDPITGVADNSWRVFGITSYGRVAECGQGAFDSQLSLAVPWIEADSGVDVTPCTDAYGTWQPGPNCGHFPLAPGASGHSWTNGCASDQLSPALSATCGAPYNSKGPQVTVTGPSSGATSAGAMVNITLTAQGSDGTALASVDATFDGAPLPTMTATAPSYAFGPLTLVAGDHTLVVVAKDLGGVSTTVTQKFVVDGNLALNALPQNTRDPGGCNAAPNGLAWLAVLSLWAAYRYRKVTTLGLLALCSLTGCAGYADLGAPSETAATGGLKVATLSTEVKGVPAPQATATEQLVSLPPEASTFAGSIAGHTLVPASSYFFYQSLQTGSTLLVLNLQSTPNGCDEFKAAIQHKSGSMLSLFLNTTVAGEDTPTDGRYTVTTVDKLVSPTGAGRLAVATFSVNSATCTDVVSTAAGTATSGEIVITTHLTNNGVYVSGTYENLVFGIETASGSFTSYFCDVAGLAQPTATCK